MKLKARVCVRSSRLNHVQDSLASSFARRTSICIPCICVFSVSVCVYCFTLINLKSTVRTLCKLIIIPGTHS